MKRLEITVHGKVQKVWFRKYTQEKAQDLGLFGYIMNQENGTVFLIVEGDESKLKQLIHWLKTKGSPMSEVKKVIIKTLDYTGDFSNFVIQR